MKGRNHGMVVACTGEKVSAAWLASQITPEYLEYWVEREENIKGMALGREIVAEQNFAFSAGAGIALKLRDGASIEELVPYYVKLAKENFPKRDDYMGVLGMMVEMWEFGGDFYKESKKQGLEWIDGVELSSKAMGVLPQQSLNDILTLGIKLLEDSSKQQDNEGLSNQSR